MNEITLETRRNPHRPSGAMADAQVLRACLVSNRVGLGGGKSAPFTRGTASREPFLRASFFGFRSVPTKESPQAGPPRTPENAKRFNPHPYQTDSKSVFGKGEG